VTGGLLVQLAAARGARVIATASAKKAERIRDDGASEVLDYHGDWPALVREITGGGAPKAVNAAPGQAATTLTAVADGGRLATITSDPPRLERGVAVSDVYVRPDGRQLTAVAELLADGTLSVPIVSVRPLDHAAEVARRGSPDRLGPLPCVWTIRGRRWLHLRAASCGDESVSIYSASPAGLRRPVEPGQHAQLEVDGGEDLDSRALRPRTVSLVG